VKQRQFHVSGKERPMPHLCFATQTTLDGGTQQEACLVNALRSSRFKRWLSNVPNVTFSFCVPKSLSPTVGETTAVFLAVCAGLGQV
jgi:hypothetical protein